MLYLVYKVCILRVCTSFRNTYKNVTYNAHEKYTLTPRRKPHEYSRI